MAKPVGVTVTYHGQPVPPAPREPEKREPPALWGWFHIAHPDPRVMAIHLMPASDIGAHAFDEGCACGCHEDPRAPGFFIHFAFDGRECYDAGRRKRH